MRKGVSQLWQNKTINSNLVAKKTTVEILEHDKFLFAQVITLRIVLIVSFICRCSF